MLILNDKQTKQLEEFIQELPVKFGVPLINLLRTFAQEGDKVSQEPESVKKDAEQSKLSVVEAE